jgi:hypothetical protein
MSTPICEDGTTILAFEKRHQAWLLRCCFMKCGMPAAACWCHDAAEGGKPLPCNSRTLAIDMTKIGVSRYRVAEPPV